MRIPLLPLLLAGGMLHGHLTARVLQSLPLESEILGQTMRYSVYLPPDYESSQRAYPVVYLLHGWSGDENDWIQFGEADRLCEEAILNGTLPPFVLIMPDAENSFYINQHDGNFDYEDYFIEELMPHVESEFRILHDRRFRVLSGLSMGGYGALILGLKHPDKFSGISALSAALNSPETLVKEDADYWEWLYARPFGEGLQGDARLTDHQLANNPFTVLAQRTDEDLKGMRIYLDCGDDDWLSTDNVDFHFALKARNIPHELRIREGRHNWEYWRSGLVDGLIHITHRFRN